MQLCKAIIHSINVFVNKLNLLKMASDGACSQSNFLDYMLEHTSDGFWDWNIQQGHEYMSPRFWQMFGYHPKTKAREWLAIIFPEDLQCITDMFDAHVASKGAVPYMCNVRCRHADGSQVYVLRRGEVVEWDADGKPVRMVGTHTDVTELHHKTVAAKVADTARQCAERALTERKTLVNYVFHEVRNPINVISTGLTLLKDELEEGATYDAVCEVINMMQRAVTRATRILNDTLDYTKLENGSFHLSLQQCNLVVLLMDTVAGFEAAAKEKCIDLTMECRSMQAMLCVDEYRICQVLENLLNNALKFTTSGGMIQVQMRVQDKQAIVAVQDTGCGIAATNLPRIFQPYNDIGDKPQQAVRGLGLGLSICKKIVEAHSGTISVESTRGQGSTFTVVLPMLPCKCSGVAGKAKRTVPDHVDSPRGSSNKGISVLLVDDDPMNRKVLSRVLEKRGYATHCMVDGQEFVECVERGDAAKYHCVVLDELMPRMNGSTALKLARREYGFNRPVIFLTGCATDDQRTKFEQLGADAVLNKPVDATRLMEVINEMVRCH